MTTHMRICGVDEAGRGPLAGAVYAAAVILDPARSISGLADSKMLSEKKRAALEIEIRGKALAFSVAEASVAEIDEINILQAEAVAHLHWLEERGKIRRTTDAAGVDRFVAV